MAEKPKGTNIEPPPGNVGRKEKKNPATSEPPPEIGGHQKSKVDSSRLEQNPQVLPNGQGVEKHLCKNKQEWVEADCSSLGRRQTGGTSASPNNPEKGCVDKQTIINVDRQTDVLIMKKSMHECMTPDES